MTTKLTRSDLAPLRWGAMTAWDRPPINALAEPVATVVTLTVGDEIVAAFEFAQN